MSAGYHRLVLWTCYLQIIVIAAWSSITDSMLRLQRVS